MLDTKTLLLIVGILVLIVIFTRKAILKQKKELANPIRPEIPKKNTADIEKSQRKVAAHWQSMGYLLGLAAFGNLYSAFISASSSRTNLSAVLWIDAGLSVTAAIVALFLWQKKKIDLVHLYMGILILQAMFFLSTANGNYMPALVHLFPLALVYMVVKPVWNDMD